MIKKAHELGLHRVIEPKGALPQAALRLDATSAGFDNEVVIDVETLNVDSASFHQILSEVGRDEDAVAERILSIVSERGKMQNPVTGSGGMLLGRVREVGPDYDGPVELKVGDRVASLVSLTLTPLFLESIEEVRLDADQVDVKGTAYLWPSSPIVVMPDDMEERVALAALDVCGAPAQAKRLAKEARTVLVLGAGKSGMLCAATARHFRGEDVRIFGIDLAEENLKMLQEAGLVDDYRCANARRPVDVLDALKEMTGGELVDLVINTCNVDGIEMAAILCARERGVVYFFNMATDFARAALGSEGVGKDIDLLIGNGYASGHAELTLEILRSTPAIQKRFGEMMSSGAEA